MSLKVNYILFLSLLMTSVFCFSLSAQNRLVPSKVEPDLYEVNSIEFKGNNFLQSDELKGILLTKVTERSIPHQTLQFYYDGIRYNGAAIPWIRDALKISMKPMINEIHFFDRLKAEEDINRIKQYYYQFGFHNTSVNFTFRADEYNRNNILTFQIDENVHAKIRAVNYSGLDSLPEEIKPLLEKTRQVKKDEFFNEFKISNDVRNIKRILLDNGYFFANYSQPVAVIDTLEMSDSVYVAFSTGKRQKIGTISFVDSTRGQNIVVYELKKRQIELKTGDWYSISSHEKSYNNLLSLGTFDMVSIDTIGNKSNGYDSVLNFRVFTQYRKQQEYGFALFTNQTAYYNAINAGVELSYFHRNIFGAAQVINPFARVVLEDLNRALVSSSNLELEYQLGLNYSQMLAWTFDEAKIGFSTQIMLSQRTLYNYLKILTFSLPVKFPVRLPEWTYYNNMSVDFSFERQQPYHLNDVISQMKKDAKTWDDSIKAEEATAIYLNLDKFLSNKKPWLTANLLGVSFIGDNRDNPFSPKSGKYSFLSIDGTNPIFYPVEKFSGIAKYARFQMTNFWFWSLSPYMVTALKQREGYIYWFDKAESYVPLERQFFCGGANSVRGWASRQLRYIKSSNFTGVNQSFLNFAKDYVGNAGLIEGSLEFRYSFGRPGYVSGFMADQISSLGITGFMDWGDGYQWLIVDDKGNYSNNYTLLDIFKGIAVSVGFGLRYDTPVGPFRIDLAWPLYDPMKQYKPLTNMQFNIGLGHAF